MANGPPIDLRTTPRIRDEEKPDALIGVSRRAGDGWAHERYDALGSQEDIDSEKTAREAADTALGTRIDNESGARQSADNTINRRIDTIDNRHAAGQDNDRNARTAAQAAHNAANANTRALTQLTERVANGEFAAWLEVDPSTVDDAAGIQRTYTARLVNPRQDLLFDKHQASPINRIQVLEEDTGTLLHDEAWLYSGDDWVFQLEISASEANAIGTTGSDEDFEVQVRFGRGTGNSFVPLEATQWARILIGNRGEFPATKGNLSAEGVLRRDGDEIAERDVADASVLANQFTLHGADDHASILRITSDFTTSTRSYTSGQRWYVAPHHSSEASLVLLSEASTSTGGQTAAQVQAAIEGRLAPFADVEIAPGGLSGNDFPESIYVLMDERLTTRSIDGLSLNFGGFTLSLHSSTPIANITGANRALARFDLTSDHRDTLATNNADTDHTNAELTFSFTSGNDYIYSLVFPVNNPSFVADAPDPKIPPVTVQTLTSAAAISVDAADGEIGDLTIAHNATINVTGGNDGSSFLLRVTQDSTGSRTLTLNSAVLRPAAVQAPTLSTAAGALDLLLFSRIGTSWYYISITNDDVAPDPIRRREIVSWNDARTDNTATLPADYGESDFVSLVWLAGQGGNAEHRFRDIPIAVLLNVATGTFRGSGGSDLEWVRSTRIITLTGSGNQNAARGIKYLELVG